MNCLDDWQVRQLTYGSEERRYHAHSYYDIQVFDGDSRRIVAHQVGFTGRHPTPEDAVTVGLVDAEDGAGFKPIGVSRAWSWQQGPLAQWVPMTRLVTWNDREGDNFVARLYDTAKGCSRTLPRTLYGLDPKGRFGLSVDMGRLETVRPGYGYARQERPRLAPHPADDGVWRVELASGETRLILSLDRAVAVLNRWLSWHSRVQHRLRRYVYWFNHVKLAPDGRRFTVKLRYRTRDLKRGWNDRMGVSLTCSCDGEDVRVLTDATSHVIWLDSERVYLWRHDGVFIFEDAPDGGRRVQQLAPELSDRNPHIRHLPATPHLFVLDMPYSETVTLWMYDSKRREHARIASFDGHVPARGPFRCDLHPCPSPNGHRIVLTSLKDGGRQLYLLER